MAVVEPVARLSSPVQARVSISISGSSIVSVLVLISIVTVVAVVAVLESLAC